VKRMKFLSRFVSVALFILFIRTDVCQSMKSNRRPLSVSERLKFQALANSSHDPNRHELVRSALREAAGVYVDEEKSKSLELQSTVITVSECP
jgi:hypothetical protein